MILHHNQKLSTAEKDEEWRKRVMDYFCNLADDFYIDWYRMEENYALKNNQLNKEEYRAICKGLGSAEKVDYYINAYNQTHNVIEAYKGEELSRPFAFDITNMSPHVANRIERNKRRDIEELIETIFSIELKRHELLTYIELEHKLSRINPKEAQQLQQQVIENYNKLYNDLPTIQDIYDKYENISTIEEITMRKIMRMMVQKLNIKYVKNKTFEDALLAGIEVVEVYQEREGELPKIKEINPLNLFYEKSPDVQFLHKSDYVGYKEYITLGQALDRYGEKLSEEDYIKLTSTGYHHGITGLNHPFQTNRQAPSEWKEVQKLGRFPSGRLIEAEDYFILDQKYGGPTNGYISSKYFSSLGLHASENRRNYADYVDVYTVYWKSYRKLGALDFINQDGELETTLVDEYFIIPKDAKKITVDSDNLTKKRTKYEWWDDDRKMSLEWIWIPEVWKGIRIGSDIYVEIGPVSHAYQSLLNPYEVKLPIHGVIYNNRNSFPVSPMDRMKPWQKIYYIIMARMLKLLAQDRGVWTFLNTHLFDAKLGVEKTMQIAEDNSVLTYNPFSNSKGAGQIGLTNTMKVAETLNLSNANLIQYYVQILQFVESNIQKAVGMNPQRLAQTNPRLTASDNYRETVHSINMSESMHATHDLLWQEILQTLMEMTLNVLSGNSNLIRGLLNDDEKTIVDLGMVTLEDNFVLKVADNSKAYKILEQSQQLTHALIQNDKADFATLLDMMSVESLTELKQMVKKVEEDFQKRIERQQQSQQEHEQQMLQMQLQAKEDEQISRLDESFLKGFMKFKTEEMRAQYQNISFDNEKDYNKDGIPDYYQLAQLQQRIENETAKNVLKSKELEHKKEEMELKAKYKKEELALKDKHKEMDYLLKSRIEKMKKEIKEKQTRRK
jgi:hypothetical protein